MLLHICRFVLICATFSAVAFAADASPVRNAVSPSRQSTSGPDLHSLTKRAGYIFQGMVTSIAPNSGKGPDGAATISITFRVTQGLRGVRDGETFSIHEWAGLWNGVERYKPGEHVLLFLYPQSRLGLTSTVGGALGRFASDKSGNILVSQPQSSLLRGAGSQPSADGKLRLTTQRFFQILQKQAEK